MTIHRYLIALLLVFISQSAIAQGPDRERLANEVKSEFMHAWNGYRKYAWGHDDLKPLSKTYHDWYKEPLLMTPVDALDTMIIMGLNEEADRTSRYVFANLSFDKDLSVQNFEITIRLLGGLLTNYQFTKDKRFLTLAEDLGNRLLPAFNSPTGMPYRFVNLRTGKTDGPVSNPAETGTLLIEFGSLSRLTGKQIFYDKAKRALVETYRRRSAIGLVGEGINVETGEWTNKDSHISGAIDSYYEYLLKCWLLFGDRECKQMWDVSYAAAKKYLRDPQKVNSQSGSQLTRSSSKEIDELWYGHADMNSGVRGATTFGALDAFFPAVIALSGDLSDAKQLQESSFKMWSAAGIEPEEFDYQRRKIKSPGYPLRPEIIESTYYLYHFTKDPRYLFKGEQMWGQFVKYCRTDEGYAALKDVVTKEKSDSMQSFLFAETFKYFYLLFSPAKKFAFDKLIFNTEAHPITRFSNKPRQP